MIASEESNPTPLSSPNPGSRRLSNYHEYIINVRPWRVTFYPSGTVISLFSFFSASLFPTARPLAGITIHVCKSRRLNCGCFACVEHPGDNRRIAIAPGIVCKPEGRICIPRNFSSPRVTPREGKKGRR